MDAISRGERVKRAIMRGERDGRDIFGPLLVASNRLTTVTPTLHSDNLAETVLFEGRPAAIAGVGALLISILTLGLGALYFFLRASGISYKVTTKRVLVERGVLSKRLEQVDAYRIRDYIVDRPFGQRLLGTGNLILLTMDKTTPSMELRNLRTDVVRLYEALRAAAEADRLQRGGVRLIDNE